MQRLNWWIAKIGWIAVDLWMVFAAAGLTTVIICDALNIEPIRGWIIFLFVAFFGYRASSTNVVYRKEGCAKCDRKNQL